MKKILLIIVAVAGCVVANAQDFDLAAIAQKLAVKADSASMIMGQLNGTQAAVNHPTTEARQQLLKSFYVVKLFHGKNLLDPLNLP